MERVPWTSLTHWKYNSGWESLKSNILFFFVENCSSPATGGPDEGLDSAAESTAAVAASVFSSGRRVTRSQQGAANTTAKKYPLRQSRSSGSDTEANGEAASVFKLCL